MTKSRPVVVIATDASVRHGRATAAWVTRRNEFATASLWPATNQTGAAEAAAVHLALTAADPTRGVHVITDSLPTLTLLRRAAKQRYPDGINQHIDTVNRIIAVARARRAPTSIHWSKGHTGGGGVAALHHAADRLAYHANRGSLRAVTGDVADGFAQDARTRQRLLLQVAATRWKRPGGVHGPARASEVEAAAPPDRGHESGWWSECRRCSAARTSRPPRR
jgi:hypothetical protein